MVGKDEDISQGEERRREGINGKDEEIMKLIEKDIKEEER